MSISQSKQSPPQSSSRKKRLAEVVSFEDLLAAHKTERGPGQLPAEGVVLIGVDLELQRRMAERLPLGAPQHAESSLSNEDQPVASGEETAIATNNGAPKFSAPNISAPELKQNKVEGLNIGAPNFGAPTISAPENTEPVSAQATAPTDSPDFDLRDLLVRRSGTKTYAVHSVSRIEDSFTSAERDLLRWLWEKGRPIPSAPKIRLVTGPNGEGARRLAAQAGLIYNTFKNLTRALSTKFAVDIVKPEKNLPTIYAVYHYSAILERQKHAGLTGVVHKNGGARELVDAQARPAIRRPDLTLEELEVNIGAPNFGALLANFGAPNFGAPLRNKEYTSKKEDTSSTSLPNIGALKFVIDALFERTGRTDANAARMITKSCLEANPTIQPEEIARLIRTAQIPSNITNPIGLLIRALPGYCSPESIANYRESWRQESEQENRRREQERDQTVETARRILDSVAKGEEWDAGTVQWARETLGTPTQA